MSRFPGFVALMMAASLAGCGGGSSPTPVPPASPPPLAPQPPAPSPAGEWLTMAPLPEARTEISAAALDGRLYIAGGAADGDTHPMALHIYDGATDAWSRGADLPVAMHHAALVGHDGKLYLIGGYAGGHGAGTPTVLDTMWVYDVQADAWSAGTAMPTARGAHAAAVVGNDIHVVGGSTNGGQTSVTTHEIYSIDNGTWTVGTPMQFARDHLAASAHDGMLYAAAGRVGSGTSALTVMERYDPVAQQWQTRTSVPTGRSGVAMVTFQGQLYLFGGETFGPEPERTYADAERYDPQSDTWEAVAPMPTARHGLGAGVIDNAIFVVAGGPQPGWTFSAVNERWTP